MSQTYEASVSYLRRHLQGFAFDQHCFETLLSRFVQGRLSPESERLHSAPVPVPASHPCRCLAPGDRSDSRSKAVSGELSRLGREAIRSGKIACLILNGGMATRFGGGTKGIKSVHSQHDVSFLQLKLAQIRRQSQRMDGAVPALVMNSFATRGATLSHLEDIQWSGVEAKDRYTFDQSIMPRIDSKGTVLLKQPNSEDWPDHLVYSAPGHGDCLARLQASGLIETLSARGVEHLMISNVDNLGATLSPELVGAHLEGVRRGREISIEAVPRKVGEKGGCIALGAQGPAVFEGFRLPLGCSLDDYPDFNTNTLWFSLDALSSEVVLNWFPVTKAIQSPKGEALEVVQFEQLIGEISESVSSQVLCVDRNERFFPIKRPQDLELHADRIARVIEQCGSKQRDDEGCVAFA